MDTEYFYIYLANGYTEITNDFSNIGSVDRDGDESKIYNYTGIVGEIPVKIEINKDNSNLNISPDLLSEVGDYSVYITGANSSYESSPSEFLHFYAGPTLSFENLPADLEFGVLNNEYTFDVDAVASDGGSVTYALLSPAGGNIDNLTGEISWTPASIGLHSLKVEAVHVDYPEVKDTLSWKVLVKSCSGTTALSGYLKNQDSEPISSATILVNTISSIDGEGNSYVLHTDIDGYFTIDVYEGVYQIRASHESFHTVWYPNAEYSEDADSIVVTCGENKEINFAVRNYEKFNVKGYVFEEKTGWAVDATVRAFAFKNNILVGYEDTYTNGIGRYSIELSNEYKYRILAFPNEAEPPLLQQYYKNGYDYLTAKELIFNDKDIDSINFYLTAPPPFVNKINGTVSDYLGNAVPSKIILYKSDEIAGCRTVETNSSGKFVINNIEPGFYIIRCLPNDDFTTGYYNNTGKTTSHWTNATKIEVKVNSQFDNYLMMLPNNEQTSGVGRIYGKITDSADSTSLQAAIVHLQDITGKTYKYFISGSDGNYYFENLRFDYYKIMIDKLGYNKILTDEFPISIYDSVRKMDFALVKTNQLENPTISFTSEPPTNTKQKELYSYDCNAVASNGDSIIYSFVQAPTGMTINSESGLINWTPEASGTFSVSVKAKAKNFDVETLQNWIINVEESIEISYLSGSVFDDKGIYYANTEITLYKLDNTLAYTLNSDNVGKFFAAVAPNSYKLKVTGQEIKTVWYDSKQDFTNANTLTLVNDDTLEIDVKVQSIYKEFNISGIVSDESSNPLDSAIVVMLIGPFDNLKYFSQFTNAKGEYNFIYNTIDESISLKLYASKPDNYISTFYQDEKDYPFVDTMTIHTNLSGMDFKLNQLPKSTIELEGQVINEQSIGVPAIVTAYSVILVDEYPIIMDAYTMNSQFANDGKYKITVPISGDYIVKAYPIVSDYYPVYCSDSLAAQYQWQTAKIVSNENPDGLKNLFIRAKKITATSGKGAIAGDILWAPVVGFMIYDVFLFQGFTVLAGDDDSNFSKYTFSAPSIDTLSFGSRFILNNLGFKKWYLYADKIGIDYPRLYDSPELSESDPGAFVNIIYTSIEENIANPFIQIYPNPAQNILNLKLMNENTNPTFITIYDKLGNNLKSLNSIDSEIRVPVSDLNSGTYYLRVINGKETTNVPFIIVK
jgi:hypothetical protein